MPNSAWCEYPRREYHKQITFTPYQFQTVGASIKYKLKSIFRGTRADWNKFFKPNLKATAPKNGMALGAKTKNPEVAKATTDILKSKSGGKILSSTDMQGLGSRVKLICFCFKYYFYIKKDETEK